MNNEKREYSYCFFGHRKIDETPALLEKRTEIIEKLITDKGFVTFISAVKVNLTVFVFGLLPS